MKLTLYKEIVNENEVKNEIHNAPSPTSTSGIRSFLGMVNYCAKFIHNFSDLTKPLRALTQKNAVFNWTEVHEQAFLKIKQALPSDIVMSYFDKDKYTEVVTDASPYGTSNTCNTKHKQAALERKNEQLCLKMRNETLGAVQNAKYLGVHIDNSLDWKKHVQETSKKISRSLGMLKYAKRYLPFHALKNLYTSVIDPSFRYCCSVWGVCGAAEIHQLQKLQNRAARLITGSNYDAPSKPLIESLGWKMINDMIQFESRVMVFKSLNRLTP